MFISRQRMLFMGEVIYFREWKRARLAAEKTAILSPRPRAASREYSRRASDLSAELMRLLMNKKAPREWS